MAGLPFDLSPQDANTRAARAMMDNFFIFKIEAAKLVYFL
jgi:hypothetical protein